MSHFSCIVLTFANEADALIQVKDLSNLSLKAEGLKVKDLHTLHH